MLQNFFADEFAAHANRNHTRPEPATDIFFGNFHTTGWNKRLPGNTSRTALTKPGPNTFAGNIFI